MAKQRIPSGLRSGIAAVLVLTGAGGGAWYIADNEERELTRDQYINALALDKSTSTAVKVAMVMGAYYESSYKHIGTPYVDKLGKGQPLTVCNGVTGPQVQRGLYYSPSACYRLEKGRYQDAERYMVKDAGAAYAGATVLQQATFLDFVWNKGAGAWSTSTMRRNLLAGDVAGACRQNERWNKGTVGGVSTVLPGLQVRANANSDLCAEGLLK